VKSRLPPIPDKLQLSDREWKAAKTLNPKKNKTLNSTSIVLFELKISD
jgi:hypothetical protein